MEEFFSHPIFVSVISTILGATIMFCVRWLMKRNKKVDSIGAGIRILMRSEVDKLYEKFVINAESYTLDDRDSVDRVYSVYHALGGNGSATKLYEELMALKITSL